MKEKFSLETITYIVIDVFKVKANYLYLIWMINQFYEDQDYFVRFVNAMIERENRLYDGPEEDIED
ncbi:MAG: hypothetical protein N4A38_05285 [Candidatus Gracilibacteria bacterium]|nr:hypothetical protein [Candidatus Gracilibacteria bacterium]